MTGVVIGLAIVGGVTVTAGLAVVVGIVIDRGRVARQAVRLEAHFDGADVTHYLDETGRNGGQL